ncbi:class IV lanthionine synthetase LanL [Nocardia sp. CA-107356]|uniref:class IV lanthionine synthetase LanL n=1 Tax=Nocardia sp. CA-107356 TaxID=3239972 RepID=UPI003D922403
MLVEDIERRLAPLDGWTVRLDDIWCYIVPQGHHYRRQGWKLHVSATVAAAPEVLDRVADVLLAAGCPFKFAATLDNVSRLNSGRYARGSSGKFVTIYPDDDDQLRELAARLHERTTGLTGPTILSDRPYAPGSLVHYRYGEFLGDPVLGNDGVYLRVLVAPDGTTIEDRRDAWFTPPPWAIDPFGYTEPPAPAVDGVLLADRYVVHRAIKHANKGGVFEATDIGTGAALIVKQARAGVGDGPDGWTYRVALRNEAEMLDLLASLGISPRPLALFEQGGDLFHVVERVDGMTLEDWCKRPDRPVHRRVIARALTASIAAVHAKGVVLRDLSPTNVMICADGSVRFIDLELAARAGVPAKLVWTPGYAAPEQIRGAVPDPAADRYALGALLFLLYTGAGPELAPDDPPGRGGRDRIASLLDLAEVTDDIAPMRPLLLGLLADEPAQRWTLDRVGDFLEADRPADIPRPADTRQEESARLLADGIDYLLASMTPDDTEALWPRTRTASRSDPCAVYHGAAGVLGTLIRVTGITADEQVRAAIRTTADWIVRRLGSQDPLPGLYFGRSGTAVALDAAGRLLGDDDLDKAAADLFDRMPRDWRNPDVTHGLAGVGMASLMLWSATGASTFRDRAGEYAERLADRVERHDGVPVWPIPDDFDSLLAGAVDYGFAHGTAGIAAFLLAAGVRLGVSEWVELATEAATSLGRVGIDTGVGYLWPPGPDADGPLAEFWCSGSAGIGTFLLQCWRATGDRDLWRYAEQAAEGVWARRWTPVPAQCHGLAGGGELMLDLADATGDDRFRRRAEYFASALVARAGIRDGRLLAPDESMTALGTDYSVGVAGWVDFLVRLHHGGRRAWTPDPR